MKVHVESSTRATIGAGVVGVLLVYLGVSAGTIGFALVLGGMLAILLVMFAGLRALALTLAFGAFFFSPMIAVRLSDSITVGDVLLVGAVAVALLSNKGAESLPASGKHISWAACLLVLGGLIGTIATSTAPTESAMQLAQYAIAVLLSLGLVRLLKPGKKVLTWMGVAYGLGASVSCLVAVMDKVNPRPAGLALHSNHLAISAALAVGIWLALLMATKSRLLALLSLAGITLCVWGTIIGGSRAGIVAIAVVVLGAVVGLGASKLSMFLLLAGGGFLYAISVGFIDISGKHNAIGRLLGGGSAEEADMGRSLKYEAVWDRINNNMFVGNGFENARDGHSLYLQMWDSGGVLGILAAVILVLAAVAAFLRARRTKNRLAVVLWSGYIGYLAAAILSNQMWDRYIWLALALAIMSEHFTPKPEPLAAPQNHVTVPSVLLRKTSTGSHYGRVPARF
ncbi:O-antigen ligase family protein [Pseudarthrobacter sp. NPDC058329]|uniref:O-antigen ligase family protein n=1 Tax=Pseudarthrobacter sp. NPDC058329 TaxID=3346448 RepID=UPI0036D89BAB